MSQWGQPRIFTTPAGSCRSVPHVVGRPFAPARHTDMIECVVTLDGYDDYQGAESLAKAFVGRPYADWTRDAGAPAA